MDRPEQTRGSLFRVFVPSRHSYLGVVSRQFVRNKAAVAGLAILIFFVLVAVIGPYLVPYDYTNINLANKFQTPSFDHLLGTDALGRDMFSRIVVGTRLTLGLSLMAVALSSIAGTFLGAMSGYLRGWVDTMMSLIMDAWLAFPALLLAMAIIAMLGISMVNLIIAVAVSGVPGFFRLARGSALSEREQDFVAAAVAIGASTRRVLVRHILPNIMAPIIIQLTLRFAIVILAISALSFLGLGAQPPSPEWGALIASGRDYIISNPHLITYPGLAIMFTVLGFNLMGDGLRDSVDPRLRH